MNSRGTRTPDGGTDDGDGVTDVKRTPVPAVPSVPSGVSVSDLGVGESLRVTWVAPSSNGGATISGYKIEVSTDSGVSWSDAVEDTGSAVVSHTVSSLTDGTPYRFKVSAINSAGLGAPSVMSGAATPTGPPNAAAVITNSVPGNATLTVTAGRLSLVNAGGLPVSYQMFATHPSNTVTYPTRSCTVVAAAIYTGNVSCQITGLRNNQTYGLTVKVVNSRGTRTPDGGTDNGAGVTNTKRTPVPA